MIFFLDFVNGLVSIIVWDSSEKGLFSFRIVFLEFKWVDLKF